MRVVGKRALFDFNVGASDKRVPELAQSALDIGVLVVGAQQNKRFLSSDCSWRSMTYNVHFILRDGLNLFPLAYLTRLDIPLLSLIHISEPTRPY